MSKPFLRNAWYVAAWSYEVGAELFERTIIGESILIFRKSDGTAVAMSNACPHRFAPLHLGKLENDVVECPYHGLRYDSTGHCVLNPHGNGKIPSRARTKTYPLVELHAMLWIWMGADALADPATIPDFSCQTDERFPTVAGVIEMHANYELIADNLMDLTHVEFLHEGILGSDAIKAGAHEISQSGTTLYSNRWCPDGLAPPAWNMMFNNYNKPVDHWLYMRWDAPAHMLLDVGITPTGRPREEGIWMYGTDILTPKDETSTHYFWGASRSYGHGDPQADKQWEEAITVAFGEQDKPLIEAQQRMLTMHGATDIDGVDAVLLPSDSGPTRARKILADLRKVNESAPPTPRNPSLSELVANSAGHYAGKVTPVV
jgi:phenylpropionate dioxygenase-like ring-hydroxylating dioxygenase large terminal subunit